MPPAGAIDLLRFDRILGLFESAQKLTNRLLILDAPEYALAASRADEADAAEFGRIVALVARARGMELVTNLNCQTAPSWAGDLAQGPLFSSFEKPAEASSLPLMTRAIMAGLMSDAESSAHIRIFYHLSAADFSPQGDQRLVQSTSLLKRGAPVTFVFDRSKQAIQLSEGIDRGCPGALVAIGLHLPRLVHQLGSGADPERFINKLGTLARLALNAAAQKRDFVKKHGNQAIFHSGFLIDRARTVIVPVGLEAAARTLVGEELSTSSAAREFCKTALERLREALQQDGPSYLLDACLDGWPVAYVKSGGSPSGLGGGKFAWTTPFSSHDFSLSPKDLLKISGIVTSAAGKGTATIYLGDGLHDPQVVMELLAYASQQTHLTGLQFASASADTMLR
jgi:hypothetical protein